MAVARRFFRGGVTSQLETSMKSASSLEIIEGFEAKTCVSDGIVFAVARHPVNPGGKAPSDSYWIELADMLKNLVYSVGGKGNKSGS